MLYRGLSVLQQPKKMVLGARNFFWVTEIGTKKWAMHDFLYHFFAIYDDNFSMKKKIVEKPCSNPFSSYPTPSLLKVPLYYKITMKNLKHAFSLFGYITIEFT